MSRPAGKVFQVSKGMRILAACFLIPLIGLCSVGSIWWLIAMHTETWNWLVLVFGLGLSALFAHLLRATLRTRLEFLSDSISYTTAWGTQKEIRFDEILGCRLIVTRNGRTVHLLPKETSRGVIRISLVFEHSGEVEQLFCGKLRNLDAEDHAAEMKEILADQKIGFSEPERLATLSQARRNSTIFNVAAIGIVFWVIIYPRPYEWIVGLAAISPILVVCFVKSSRGLITIEEKRNSARSNVAASLLALSFALALRGLKDWHILAWTGFWTPFTIIAGVVVAVLWFGLSPSFRGKPAAWFLVGFVSLAHAFGSVMFLNCEFDRSAAAVHKVVVQSRRINRSSKSTNYYLTVRPWLDGALAGEIAVDRSTYEQHSEGSTALVIVRQGELGVPWYFVR